MILRSFEVKNFRSINSLTRCEVEDDITVLAGKNESGKSNLLRALVAFNSGKFTDLDKPGGSGNPSIITVYFSVTKDEIEGIAREAFRVEPNQDFEFKTKLPKSDYELIFKRSMSSADEILVSGSAVKALTKLRNGELKYWTEALQKAMQELKNTEVTDNQRKKLESIKSDNESSLLQLTSELVLSSSKYKDLSESLVKLRSDIEKYQVCVTFYSNNFEFKTRLWNSAPKFILFDSFEDILPDEANEDDANSSEIIKRFFQIVGIDPNRIFSETDSRKRRTIVDRASSEITGDFCGYYQQSEVKIQLDVDGPKIQFYIKDGENSVPFFPAQRSKGFQWFLSFYLTLFSAGHNQNLIILIDEPGLYLHPKAQQEVLEILDDLAIANQVIFTTHSPYLIDTEHLNRIRLVQRKATSGSTFIENKIQKGADKDTLTPIVTAIGYSFGQGLSVGKSLNIVTEGISDAYYLRAFIRMYRFEQEKDIGVIGAVGASQVPNIVSILLGWNVKCVALFDNDKEGKKFHDKLVKNLNLIDGEDVVYVSPTKDEAIEDLFSKSDFQEYVLVNKSKVGNEPIKNSELARDQKVILAKKFYELVCSHSGLGLSVDTEGNILHLLDNLKLLHLNAVDTLS